MGVSKQACALTYTLYEALPHTGKYFVLGALTSSYEHQANIWANPCQFGCPVPSSISASVCLSLSSADIVAKGCQMWRHHKPQTDYRPSVTVTERQKETTMWKPATNHGWSQPQTHFSLQWQQSSGQISPLEAQLTSVLNFFCVSILKTAHSFTVCHTLVPSSCFFSVLLSLNMPCYLP